VPARIREFALFDKELDADDGELTRTQKVRRGTILTKYRDMIERLYAGSAAESLAGSGERGMTDQIVFMLQLVITGWRWAGCTR